MADEGFLTVSTLFVLTFVVIFWKIISETAMGHKRMGKDDDGFKYAMAVMK